MKKISPAKQHFIITAVCFCCLIFLLNTSVVSQDNSKQLANEDQIKLQTAYREWQDSAKTTEIMRLKFNGLILETMANMGLPPKENDISIDSSGKFVISKRPVPANKKEQ